MHWRLAAATTVVLVTISGAALGSTRSNPGAEDVQGSFTLSDPSYPSTPTSCGSNWLEVRNQTYHGTISSTNPAFGGRTLVLLVQYLGGAIGTGVLVGQASMYDTSQVPAVKVASGPVYGATNGYVPPATPAHVDAAMFLNFTNGAKTVLSTHMEIDGETMAGGFGRGTGKSVYWNGQTC